jgi:hypothetical protein
MIKKKNNFISSLQIKDINCLLKISKINYKKISIKSNSVPSSLSVKPFIRKPQKIGRRRKTFSKIWVTEEPSIYKFCSNIYSLILSKALSLITKIILMINLRNKTMTTAISKFTWLKMIKNHLINSYWIPSLKYSIITNTRLL